MKFLMKMKDYPPSQTPGAFNLSKIQAQLDAGGGERHRGLLVFGEAAGPLGGVGVMLAVADRGPSRLAVPAAVSTSRLTATAR